MSENDFNIKYIREKTGLVENDELISIILEMIKDSYKAGLCQAEYDNTMDLIEENKTYKEVIDKSIKCIDYNNRYRNGADIYQFVDIKSEILEPLKDILEQDEENSNIYLKEFNDWLKEVE